MLLRWLGRTVCSNSLDALRSMAELSWLVPSSQLILSFCVFAGQPCAAASVFAATAAMSTFRWKHRKHPAACAENVPLVSRWHICGPHCRM